MTTERKQWRQRRSPLHNQILGNSTTPALVFLTACSNKRKPIFANRDANKVLIAAWQRAEGWQVGRYVIMPDHIHLFCAPVQEAIPLVRWVSFWKSLASRHWPNPADHPIWQRDFWDTQLRHGDRYAQKWEYVRHNPVRHRLVANPEEWPFQGEMNSLSWA
jgi:REP element-mobilizing transposase RayT